jgi:hypothetical protein
MTARRWEIYCLGWIASSCCTHTALKMLSTLLKYCVRRCKPASASKCSDINNYSDMPLAAKSVTPNTVCDICSEAIGHIRHDGSTEIPYKLPCSHVFGNTCILRWLEVSSQQDCPICRRKMVHPRCGHLIMPHNATTAPPSIPAHETPELCLRCRGEVIVGPALRSEYEWLQVQEDALRGIQLHLPRFFQTSLPRTGWSVEERIAELQKGFDIVNESAWREFEERERRERW